MPTPDVASAEAIAWPLVDPGAFNRADVALRVDEMLPNYSRRARHCGLPDGAPDTAHHAWQGGGDVFQHLTRHAKALLEPDRTGVMALVPDGNSPGAEILRWRRISLALPAGILTAAAAERGALPAEVVRVLDPAIEPRSALAHQHVHAGAAFRFEILWTRLATNLGIPANWQRVAALKPGAPALPDAMLGIRWAEILLATFAVRQTLGAHFLGARQPRTSADAEQLAEGLLCSPEATLPLPYSLRGAWASKLRASRPWPRRRLQTPDDVWDQDPLGVRGSWPEGALLHQGFRQAGSDLRIDRLFVQYLRVKTMTFRLLVSDVAEPGLDVFVRKYSVIRSYKSDLEPLGIFETARSDLDGLESIEVRTAPHKSLAETLDLVTTRSRPRRPSPAGSPIQWGWILHFIRNGPTGDWSQKVRDQGDIPVRISREHRAGAVTLERAISRWPQLLTVLRGLDLASDELRGPLWLALPHITRLLEVSRRVAAASPRPVRRLQLTLHAGEHFRHFLTGLRHTHEPLLWQMFRPGDRIGHALVLGLDVDAWLSAHPRVHQPVWERMLDLAWVQAATIELRVEVGATRLRAFDAELDRVKRMLFGRDAAYDPHELYRRLGTPGEMRALGLHHGVPWRAALPSDVVRAFVDPVVVRRWHDQVEVDTSGDGELLKALQHAILERLARHRIAVELNPSSNLLVHGMKQAVDQPMFRLRPLPGAEHRHVVATTLSADDPLSFATCLDDELAYAWAGIVVGGGEPARSAAEWLEDAARSSMRTRFTVPESLDLAPTYPSPGMGRHWHRVTKRPLH